ncbi:MAG: phage minor capsid protein [Oscillospiraceae bacterium]
MLTPEYLEHCTDDIIELTNKLEETIMRDIARRLVKNGGVTASAKWQIDTVKESGLLYEDIISQVSAFANTTEPYTKALFEDAGVTSVDFDNTIYKAAGLEPISLRKSPAAMQVLLAGLKKTNNLISNLTKTTANGAQRLYIEVAALAEMQIESGAFDYASAIKNAIRNAAKDGAFVVYPSGHRDRIDVAIRRAVLTGVGQTTAEISLSNADDMGCDLVETSAHAGARPDHAIWQGKIFSRSGKSKKYPDFVSFTGYGTGAGLCGWNCRHSFYPFFEGLSESAYPREQLAEYNSRTVTYNGEIMSYYDATQMQRSKEKRIRSTKRELVGFDEAIKNGLKVAQIDFNMYSVSLKHQKADIADFLQQTGLLNDKSRTQVLNFNHSIATKSVWSVKRNVLTNSVGDEIIKINRTNVKALPNSITQKTNNKGGIDRNYYDKRGMQIKQISNNDHGHKLESTIGTHGEHAHDYWWDENGKPHHLSAREITDTERKDNSDIL